MNKNIKQYTERRIAPFTLIIYSKTNIQGVPKKTEPA